MYSGLALLNEASADLPMFLWDRENVNSSRAMKRKNISRLPVLHAGFVKLRCAERTDGDGSDGTNGDGNLKVDLWELCAGVNVGSI